MSIEKQHRLDEFQRFIRYQFKNVDLLRQALTTPMRGRELGLSHYNDILETLGDSVLKTIFILKKYKEKVLDPEIITKTKQAIENNDALTFIAEEYFGINDYVFASFNQKISGTSILADVLEAICGAIFIDSDLSLETVERVVVDIFYEDWEEIIKDTDIFNKNLLLEFLQKIHRTTPRIVAEFEKKPPDHLPQWIAKNPKILDNEENELYSFPGLKSKTYGSKLKAEQDLYKSILKKLKKKV